VCGNENRVIMQIHVFDTNQYSVAEARADSLSTSSALDPAIEHAQTNTEREPDDSSHDA
jgi:hypothetical protein